MNAALLCVGRLKEDWQRAACAEYQKRLSRYGRFELIETPDYKEPPKPTPALEKQVILREGAELLRQIRPGDTVVALVISGEAPDSVALARRLEELSMNGRRIVFVIGGSLGLSPEVVARADLKLSFSNLTFPHPLMRVILLEQLYRSCKISAGERYHK